MSHPKNEPNPPRRRTLASVLGIVVLLAVVALTWWVDGDGDPGETTAAPAGQSATSVPAAERSRTAGRPSSSVPARVARTLDYIDAGDWPEAADAPGTHGGDTFRNREGRLPERDADGERITYREWDVNPKRRGQGRDAERIVTGSDGSAYYTLDHYATFTEIRGPSR